MGKTKYRFDTETLSYKRIILTPRQKIMKVLTFVGTTFVLAAIFTFLYPKIYNSPTEKRLNRELEQMQFQYSLLNKKAEHNAAVLKDIELRDDNIYRTIFSAEPIPSVIRNAGIGGGNRYSNLEGYEYSDIVISTAEKIDKISKKLVVQSQSYDEVIEMAMNKDKMLVSIPAIQPLSNKDLTRFASGWGWRIHPIYKIRKFHYGIDFTAPKGTDVYSTGNGVVVKIKKSRYRGYGNEVVIDHGYGYKTLYAHLNGFNVKRGDKVKRGDIIGYVGNTGLSTAPHLHYEVHKNGKRVNPRNYFFKDLTPVEYKKMIELSSNSSKAFD